MGYIRTALIAIAQSIVDKSKAATTPATPAQTSPEPNQHPQSLPPEVQAVIDSIKARNPGANITAIDFGEFSGKDAKPVGEFNAPVLLDADIPAMAQTGPKRACGCRGRFLEFTTPQHIEESIGLHAGALPAAIADAIHERATALNKTGVVGAQDVIDCKNGRGELAAALANQMPVQVVADVFAEQVVAMFTHGGNVTKADTVAVCSAMVSSLLTFCITDLSQPTKSTH